MASHNLASLPTPSHVTVLFKRHKSTTFLSVLPTDDLSTMKAMLLAALEARNVTNLPGSESFLPTNPDDLEFGILVDRKDASKGWMLLDEKEHGIIDNKNGKKKAANKKAASGDNNAKATITDGTWIAYRIKSSNSEISQEELPDLEDDPGWDVILPSFEDEEDEVES